MRRRFTTFRADFFGWVRGIGDGLKDLKEAWIVEGIMPERALDRLQRAGITVFQAKKIKKMQILFHISKKDIEKAFAIYPNMCYNNIRGSVYTFTRVGALTTRERDIKRHRLVGILLGVCCWLIAVLISTGIVFKIEVVGSTIYKREAISLLRENGVKEFKVYPKEKQAFLIAKIMELDGVEFCSIQKQGNTVRVEIRQNPIPSLIREDGDLVSPRTCRIESVVTLSGTILKKSGEILQAGESIVGGFFIGFDGESKTPTHVVAKAKLFCEEELILENEELARTQAILYVENIGGELISMAFEELENGVKVNVEFFLNVKKNM